jgi:hypothetical protein
MPKVVDAVFGEDDDRFAQFGCGIVVVGAQATVFREHLDRAIAQPTSISLRERRAVPFARGGVAPSHADPAPPGRLRQRIRHGPRSVHRRTKTRALGSLVQAREDCAKAVQTSLQVLIYLFGKVVWLRQIVEIGQALVRNISSAAPDYSLAGLVILSRETVKPLPLLVK